MEEKQIKVGDKVFYEDDKSHVYLAEVLSIETKKHWLWGVFSTAVIKVDISRGYGKDVVFRKVDTKELMLYEGDIKNA